MATRRVLSSCLLVLASCGDFPAVGDGDGGITGDADPTVREEVGRFPVITNRDVDLLFVVDDSPSMLPLQDSLRASFPAFINELSLSTDGLPNLHIGVVTTDLGTMGAEDSVAGPGIGSGPGSCSGNGKGGNLTTNGSTLINGAFISDTKNSDGTRSRNYTGTLQDAFSAIASVGAAGCGFEQHVQAAKRALDANPANAGFLRPAANLAIVIVGDEDDCSFAHSTLLAFDPTTLGPLQSFRCTRFGVTCAVNGTTSDEMNMIGTKSMCQSNESSAYLTKIDSYPAFFTGLKPSPDMVSVGVLAGPVTPFEVVLKTPPGGGTAIPALAASCNFMTSTGPAEPVPAVRLAQFAAAFSRTTFAPTCSPDLTAPLMQMARNVRSLVGDTCLMRDIAMPANCTVTDVTSSMSRPVPPCSSSVTTNCYELVMDAAACSTGQHLRLEVRRSLQPAPDTVTIVRCVI